MVPLLAKMALLQLDELMLIFITIFIITLGQALRKMQTEQQLDLDA
jgi:hypothetical protein